MTTENNTAQPSVNMIDRIRELAMEKFASKTEVDAFMEAFSEELGKEASFVGNALSTMAQPEFAKNMVEHGGKMALGLGASMIGALAVKGISSGYNAVTNHNLRGKFELALSQVMGSSQMVKSYPPEKIKSYANSLFSFAPHVCADPNMLTYLLSNVVQGEGIDARTIEMLLGMENNYTKGHASTSIPTFKA